MPYYNLNAFNNLFNSLSLIYEFYNIIVFCISVYNCVQWEKSFCTVAGPEIPQDDKNLEVLYQNRTKF